MPAVIKKHASKHTTVRTMINSKCESLHLGEGGGIYLLVGLGTGLLEGLGTGLLEGLRTKGKGLLSHYSDRGSWCAEASPEDSQKILHIRTGTTAAAVGHVQHYPFTLTQDCSSADCTASHYCVI